VLAGWALLLGLMGMMQLIPVYGVNNSDGRNDNVYEADSGVQGFCIRHDMRYIKTEIEI